MSRCIVVEGWANTHESVMLSHLSREVFESLVRLPDTIFGYGVRLYACPGPRPRLLVVLGESHFKPRWEAEKGRELVRHFALRGVEGFGANRLLFGHVLGFLVGAPRWFLRMSSLGWFQGSTITDARKLDSGVTVLLERTNRVPLRLHLASVYTVAFFLLGFATPVVLVLERLGHRVPFNLLNVGVLVDLHLLALLPAYRYRKRWWSALLHPAISILSTRDELMANGTVRMLAEHQAEATAVTIMGRAHLAGYGKELEERGFVHVPFRRWEHLRHFP